MQPGLNAVPLPAPVIKKRAAPKKVAAPKKEKVVKKKAATPAKKPAGALIIASSSSAPPAPKRRALQPAHLQPHIHSRASLSTALTARPSLRAAFLPLFFLHA